MLRPWQTLRSIPRLRQIFMVLARHGFGHILSTIHVPFAARILSFFRKREPSPTLTQPQRLRRVLEDLGPTFIKFGQLLASRPDILPPAYIEELSRLQDQAEPVPFEELRPIIEQELEGPLEKHFGSVDPKPLGSASVAQVHRARLHDGTQVVVKIQRPNVHKTIAQDLQLLHLLAEVLGDREELAPIDPVGMVRTFERAIWRELDFRHELHNLERLARDCADQPVRIPKPFPSLSSRRVLTMEYLQGPSLKAAQIEPAAGKRLARDLTATIFHQIFFHGVFHADPHPGNLLLTPEGRLGLIDFGAVARLGPRALSELVGFVLAVVQRDYHLFARQILKAGYVGEDVDLGELTAELVDFLDPYYDLPLSDIDIGPLINDLFGILLRYRIRLPSHYVILGRALVTLEGTVRYLDPRFSVVQELTPHVKALLNERWKPKNLVRELRADVAEVISCVRDFPATVADLMRRTREGTLRAQIAVEGLQQIEKRLHRLNVHVALGLLANGLLLSGTLLLVLLPQSQLAVTAGVGAYVVSFFLGLWFMRPHRH